MRVLFVMRHMGYLKPYEAVLASLLQQGHDVHAIFSTQKRGTAGWAASLRERHAGFTWSVIDKPDPLSAPAMLMGRAGNYLRYLIPPCDDCPKVRARAAQGLPRWIVRLCDRVFTGRPARVRRVWRVLGAIERALACDPLVTRLFATYQPDVVLVTPYVGDNSQIDFIKRARETGVPSALCVASWDNLTNKGVVRLRPDMVILWNEYQKQEAIELHGFPDSCIRVTGAQNYDVWLNWKPARAREAFGREVGLRVDRPFVVYLGSSRLIAPHEVSFALRWVSALRSSAHAAVRDLGVLVRPHPYNARQWDQADLSGLGNVVIWPPQGENPYESASRTNYFDSLFHSAAAIGVNTSAQIEAGLIGRPVFTIRAEEFADTQEGTLHFRHLVRAGGGLLHVADSIGENLQQLQELLDAGTAGSSGYAMRNHRFVEAFVRPHGVDEPAAPRVVAAIHELSRWQPASWLPSPFERFAAAAAAALVGALASGYLVGGRWWIARARPTTANSARGAR
jgi:hypothetical protein